MRLRRASAHDQARFVAIHDHDGHFAAAGAAVARDSHREVTAAAADVDDDGAPDPAEHPIERAERESKAERPAVQAREIIEIRPELRRRHRAVAVFELVLRPMHAVPRYQRSSAPSAANPGPRPTMTPHSPGTAGCVRSTSSSTKRIVADDMF